jgi:hypothetical protein
MQAPVRCSHAPGSIPGQPSLGSKPEYEKIGNAPDASTFHARRCPHAPGIRPGQPSLGSKHESLILAARGDIKFSNDGFRYEHNPCKNDQHAKIWKGPSPLFPAIPSRLCCPLRAIQVRDALLPGAAPTDPLFAVYARDGALRPLTGKQLKSLALDKLLHLCPASCTSVSARVGHATAAFSAGMSADAIKQFGKWRSDTWRTYARVTDDAARQYVSAVFA